MLPVIIVDDSPEDLFFLRRVFQQCKILNPIHEFPSGDDCLQFLNGVDSYLLLVDLIMAPTSGLDVLRHLARDKSRRPSVAIMLSRIENLKAIKEGYQLGAA